MKHTKSFAGTKGFTIIEVALVLAIAGLIFLVVFLALPALQNSQKDTAAKEDAGRIVSALQSYSADNQGSLPTGPISSWSYAGASNLSQIKTVNINSSFTITATPPTNTTTATVSVGWVCSNGAPTTTNASSSDAAVQVLLTNGTKYCASM